MKRVSSLLSVLFLAAACASRRELVSEEVMLQRWGDFMTPSAGHAQLAPKVGSWNLVVRMFSAPGAPAQESRGTSTMQWIMDGRYLQDTTTGDFNGQPFQGLGLTGYDNLKKVYVGSWVDNFGSGILLSEGHYDAATRTFHYESSMPEFTYANDYVPSRSTERWTDADHFVMQSFTPDANGDEFLSMEIEYSRMR